MQYESNNIQKALLQSQFSDGSWQNSSCLLVPEPKYHKKVKVDQFPINTVGTNVRGREFNRLFTTSTVLKSLVEYDRRINS